MATTRAGWRCGEFGWSIQTNWNAMVDALRATRPADYVLNGLGGDLKDLQRMVEEADDCAQYVKGRIATSGNTVESAAKLLNAYARCEGFITVATLALKAKAA